MRRDWDPNGRIDDVPLIGVAVVMRENGDLVYFPAWRRLPESEHWQDAERWIREHPRGPEMFAVVNYHAGWRRRGA